MTSSQNSDADRFQALLAKHLVESLTESENNELDNWLESRPDLMETYVEQIWLDTMLHHELESEAELDIDLFEREVSLPEPAGKSASNLSNRPVFAWIGSLALIAGVIALVLLFSNPTRNASSVVVSANAAPSHVAVMLDSEDAVWGKGARRITSGSRLNQSSAIMLESGLVRLKFNCGAGVVIKGPAHLELRSAWEVYLHQGQLAVVAPEGAEGFVVLTPEMKITDLGTKFGASVGSNGRADVQVYEGEVEVESRESNKPAQKLLLNANRQARYSQSGEPQPEIALTSVDSIETVSLPSYEQLSAARSGTYPPRQRSSEPAAAANALSGPEVIDQATSIPNTVLLGEDFIPQASKPLTNMSRHPWILDSKFARVIYREQPLAWNSLSGGNYVMQIDGRDPAFPFIVNRLATRLGKPLQDEFYFSFLARYDGLDEDDFFALWFDNKVGEGLSHADRPNAGIRFGEYFSRLHMDHAAYHGVPTNQETFFLVGRLQKNSRGRFSKLSIWINPNRDEMGPPHARSIYTGSRALTSIGIIGLRMGKNTELQDKLLLDRIVIGTTLQDVVTPVTPIDRSEDVSSK